MKKLLKQLESLGELKLLDLDQTKMVYGGSISYDHSTSSDTSTSYDSSNYGDSSTNHD